MCCWLAMGGQVIFVKELILKFICKNIKNTQGNIKNQKELKIKSFSLGYHSRALLHIVEVKYRDFLIAFAYSYCFPYFFVPYLSVSTCHYLCLT